MAGKSVPFWLSAKCGFQTFLKFFFEKIWRVRKKALPLHSLSQKSLREQKERVL
jgi:hypothetical protein